MALACINGSRECDGCMECRDNPESVGKCSVCMDPIHLGDDHYNFDDELVCEDCLYDWAKKFKVVIT